jgi:hypothetical protein
MGDTNYLSLGDSFDASISHDNNGTAATVGGGYICENCDDEPATIECRECDQVQ